MRRVLSACVVGLGVVYVGFVVWGGVRSRRRPSGGGGGGVPGRERRPPHRSEASSWSASSQQRGVPPRAELGCVGVRCCFRVGDAAPECVEAEIEVASAMTAQTWGAPLRDGASSWRLRHLIADGLRAHPHLAAWEATHSSTNGSSSSSSQKPDLVLWYPTVAAQPPSPKALGGRPRREHLVVVDERDTFKPHPGLDALAGDYLVVFKRSFVRKRDGALVDAFPRVAPRYYPFQYALADSYLRASSTSDDTPTSPRAAAFELPAWRDRPLDVVCTLRVGRGEFQARARVLDATRRAMLANGWTGYAGELDSGSRTKINEAYHALMRRAKVVVTAQPGEWEGDFRTFEALASGALVVSDRLFHAPSPRPLVAAEHYVAVDVAATNNYTATSSALERTLRYYLVDRPDLAERIAAAGFRHALRYHRTVSRVDWLVRSALAEQQQQSAAFHHHHQRAEKGGPPAKYNETARVVYDRGLRRWKEGERQRQFIAEAPPVTTQRLDDAAIAALRVPLDRRRSSGTEHDIIKGISATRH